MISIKKRLPIEKPLFDSFIHAFIPPLATIPFATSLSDEVTTIVKVGSVVQEGQMIAQNHSTGCNTHASTPGIVESITEESMPNGKKSLSATIRTQGKFSYLGRPQDEFSWRQASPDKISKRIADRGVINTFVNLKPQALIQQIQAVRQKDSRPLVVRLYDDDPSCTVDSFVVKNFFHKVFEGALILATAINSTAIYILFDIKERQIVEEKNLSSVLSNAPVFFVGVDTRDYPNAGCGELIQIIKKYNSKYFQGGSIHRDDLMVDAVTALSVYDCVVYDTPVIETFVQISGDAITEGQILKVRIGTPLENLIEECHGYSESPVQYIINGLLKGVAVNNLKVPVAKYVKSLTVLSRKKIHNVHSTACVRCGECRKICPVHLHPDTLYLALIRPDKAPIDIVKTADVCFNCKLCNAACPARLPLSQAIAQLQKTVKQQPLNKGNQNE